MKGKHPLTKMRKVTRFPPTPWPSSKRAKKANTNTATESALLAAGWTFTKAGRWIDPSDGRSYERIEAYVRLTQSLASQESSRDR